jgi:hypothetical protein
MSGQMNRQQFTVVVVLLVVIAASIFYSTYSANVRASDRIKFESRQAFDKDFNDVMSQAHRAGR